MGTLLRAALSLLLRLRHRTDGNATIIFAFSALPMIFCLGAGIDYGLAMKRQTRMGAAADAAALAAVTPLLMSQNAAFAQYAAASFFNSQVNTLAGVNYSPTNVTVRVTDTGSGSTISRNVTVIYTATSNNTFAGILGMPTLTIKGTSSSTATVSANIDFYLMLDTSPSMEIAATQDGINRMVAMTPSQGGCAFACHEINPASDNLGNPGGVDNYTLARNNNIPLRIDNVNQAVSSLIAQAAQTSAQTNANYRMAGYTFDFTTRQLFALTSNLTSAQQQASSLQALTVYNNSGYLTSSFKNNDADTDFGAAFSTLNSAMPQPGNGSNVPGDAPQEVLFIVTDGVSDYAAGPNYSSRSFVPFGPATNAGVDWCAAIKSRNIRIAVLYTTYYPLPSNGFYMANIAPLQPTIATKAKACASPGLFYQVDTGGDITAAMLALFQTAVASAHLTY